MKWHCSVESMKYLGIILLVTLSINSFGHIGLKEKASKWSEVVESGNGKIIFYWYRSDPLIYEDQEHNQLAGIEHEIANAFKQFTEEQYQVTLESHWVNAEKFEDLIVDISDANGGVFGMSGISITESRKELVQFTPPHMPDICVIVSSQQVPVEHSFSAFRRTLTGLKAMTLKGSIFEQKLLEIQRENNLAFDIAYIDGLPELISQLESMDDGFGYLDLPTFLNELDQGTSVRRQYFYPLKLPGLSFAYPKESDWNEPVEAYFNSAQFEQDKHRIINKYLGQEIIALMNRIAESENLGPEEEIIILTKEKELQYQELWNKSQKAYQDQILKDLLIAGVIIVFLIAFIFFNRYTLKTRAHLALTDKQNQIEDRNQQLTKLIEDLETQTELLNKKSKENEILYRVSGSLIAEKDYQALLELIIESAVNLIDKAEKGSIILFNEQNNSLEAKAVYGYPKSLIPKIKFKIGEGQAGMAVKEKTSFIVNELEEFAEFTKQVNNWDPIKSMIQVVLNANGKILGTLSIDNLTEFNVFTHDDLKILELFASNASIVIERAMIHDQLKQLHQEKDAMIHIVAHDLKSPFNSIKGLTELVQLEGKLSQEQLSHMSLINKLIHQGTELIQNLSDVNGLERNEIEIDASEIDIVSLITGQLEGYRRLSSNKDQNLIFDSVVKDCLVTTDTKILARILDNLVTNAIKFSERNKNIWIQLDVMDDQFLNLSIKDEGPGLSTEDQSKLFQPFQKLSNRPTAGESSTGLGLSIVKDLTESLGGSIQVASELNKGTTFTIFLPRKFESKPKTVVGSE